MSDITEKPKKSNFQKMLDGELYNATLPEILDPLYDCKEKLYDFNNLRPKEFEKRKEIIRKLFKRQEKNFILNHLFIVI